MTSADRKIMWIAGGLLVVLTLAAILSAPTPEADPSPIPSTYLSTPGGARAAFLLLQKMGVKAQRWEEPPFHLDGVASETTVVIAEPTVTPSHAERSALRHFVETGGRLVFCGPKLADFLPHVELRKFRLPLRTEPDRLLVGAWTLGAGDVVWWESAAPLTNAGLTRAGNLSLFLNSVGVQARKVIYWDEYFHGERGSLWDYIGRIQAIRWAALPFALLAAAAVLTFSRRRGPVIPPVRVSRLSPLEFVDSLGSLYRKANAASLPVDVAARELRLQVIRRLGLRADISDADLAREAGARLGWKEHEVHDVLARARATMTSGSSSSSALKLVQSMQRFTATLAS